MRARKLAAALLVLVAVPAMAAAPTKAGPAKPGALHYVWSAVEKMGGKVEGPVLNSPEGGGGRPCLQCHVIVGTGI